jgi:CRISPR-associated protein Cmr5
MGSEIQTLDQKRAAHAWNVVTEVKALCDEAGRKQFGTQAKKLPTRIMAAGLGQALAFLEGKDYAPMLRKALTDWIADRRPPRPDEDRNLLVVRIIQRDADFLRFATAECLAYLQWLVRFADAEGLTEGD